MDKERKKQLKNQAKRQQNKKEKNQRNIMLSNVFTIIAVIVGILLVIGMFGETAQLIGLIILAFAIAWLLLYTVRSARKTRQEKKEYLEKNAVKYQSKMNNRTGEITLFSFDYPSRGSQRWTVSNSAITIFEKDSNSSTTIPFSQVHRVNLNHGNPIGNLEIEVIAMCIHDASGNGTWGVENRLEAVSGGQIFYHEHDFNLASTIRDRITGS